MKRHQSHLDWISNEHSIMIKLVEKWALVNSWSHNIDGLRTLLEILADDFKILGGKQEIISFQPIKTVDNQGNIIEKSIGQTLSIKKRMTAPIQLLLGGHMDTVYPPHSDFQHVLIEKEMIKGPGVTDMKGGLVVLLKALQALERSPYAESIGWEIIINADEEIGSPGSINVFKEAAHRNHIGLIFEPSLPDGSFVCERKGTANFTLVVKGRSAHAGRDFHNGRSAIYAIAHLIHKIELLNDPIKDITLNVGHIEGGGPVNIVPDRAICKINMRAHNLQDMEYIGTHMRKIVNEGQSEGITCELIEDSLRMPKSFDKRTEKLFQLYETCATQLSIPFYMKSSGGACDGNILASAGLTTIDSLGVVGGKIHTHEEYLIPDSLKERAQLAALFLLEIASGHIILHSELP